MKKPKYDDVIKFRIQGIPCLIGIDYYFNQPAFRGSPHLCDSDMDYYGYTECEFTVLDRKGYVADWLANKITNSIKEDIEAAITKYYSK